MLELSSSTANIFLSKKISFFCLAGGAALLLYSGYSSFELYNQYVSNHLAGNNFNDLFCGDDANRNWANMYLCPLVDSIDLANFRDITDPKYDQCWSLLTTLCKTETSFYNYLFSGVPSFALGGIFACIGGQILKQKNNLSHFTAMQALPNQEKQKKNCWNFRSCFKNISTWHKKETPSSLEKGENSTYTPDTPSSNPKND